MGRHKNTSTLVKDVRNLASTFKSIIELADKLDDIGKIEQAEKEARVREDKAVKNADAADKTLRDLKTEIEAANLQVSNAKSEAKGIVEAAKGKAVVIETEAKTKADKILDDADTMRNQIADQVTKLQEEIKTLDNTLGEKKKEHDELDKAIGKLKAKAAALIGE